MADFGDRNLDVSWQIVKSEDDYSKGTVIAQIKFSAPSHIISDNEAEESGNESIRENIRLAFKSLITELFTWNYVRTAASWNLENNIEFKVYWESQSEVIEESIHNHLRREDVLSIEVCLHELGGNWQDETSLILEKFNYNNINQTNLKHYLPEQTQKRIGFSRIGKAEINKGLVKISISVQYIIGG